MLDNVLVVANVFSGPLPADMRRWLEGRVPAERIIAHAKQVPFISGRNSAIRDAMFPALQRHPGTAWCWFLDNDVLPAYPGLDEWLAVPGDVVSCRSRMANSHAWCTPDAFHDHLWRCRPAVLYKIPPPWFTLNLSADGCDLLGCECMTFAARVKAAGFTLAHGGWCEHGNARSWE